MVSCHMLIEEHKEDNNVHLNNTNKTIQIEIDLIEGNYVECVILSVDSIQQFGVAPLIGVEDL